MLLGTPTIQKANLFLSTDSTIVMIDVNAPGYGYSRKPTMESVSYYNGKESLPAIAYADTENQLSGDVGDRYTSPGQQHLSAMGDRYTSPGQQHLSPSVIDTPPTQTKSNDPPKLEEWAEAVTKPRP